MKPERGRLAHSSLVHILANGITILPDRWEAPTTQMRGHREILGSHLPVESGITRKVLPMQGRDWPASWPQHLWMGWGCPYIGQPQAYFFSRNNNDNVIWVIRWINNASKAPSPVPGTWCEIYSWCSKNVAFFLLSIFSQHPSPHTYWLVIYYPKEMVEGVSSRASPRLKVQRVYPRYLNPYRSSWICT